MDTKQLTAFFEKHPEADVTAIRSGCLAQFMQSRTRNGTTNNLEQEQARADEMRETLVQVLLDNDFPVEILRSLPTLADPCDADIAILAMWWDDFNQWMIALPLDVALRLSAVTVIW